MAPEQPEQGGGWSESSQPTGASSNEQLAGKQLQCRHQLVHHDDTNAANEVMTQEGHSIIFCKTESCINK